MKQCKSQERAHLYVIIFYTKKSSNDKRSRVNMQIIVDYLHFFLL